MADRKLWFVHFAQWVSHVTGRPATFLLALASIVIWAMLGPIFGFSDTWQLVINTATTIITFLMVFVIQNTQNRDQMAIQIKLAELIVAMKGAHNNVAVAEEMPDEDLERLHVHYQSMCEQTHKSLTARRSAQTPDKPKQGSGKARKKAEKSP